MLGGPVIYPALQPFLQIWDGLPGMGKSYCLAYNQIQWRLAGHPVVTNLKIRSMPFLLINRKARQKQWGEYVLLDDQDFVCTQYTEPGFIRKLAEVKERNPGKHILLVIDEVPDYYPAEESRTLSKPLQMWLRKHRHMDTSIIVTAQSYDMMATAFRKLAARFRHHKNLVGDPVLNILLWWFSDNFHMAYSVTGVRGKPIAKDIFDRRYFTIKGKTVGQMYDTTQMHGSDLAGGIRKAKSKVLRWCFGLVFLSIVLGAAYLIYNVVVPESRPRKARPAKVVQVPQETYTVDVVERRGDSILMELVSAAGHRRYQVIPYQSADQFFELSDRIGQTSSVPVVTGRAMAGILVERGK